MECDWAVICEHAIVAIDGRMSAIGVFDAMEPEAFPYQHDALAIVLRLHGMPERTFQLRVEFAKPNGDVLHQAEGTVTMQPTGVAYLTTRVVGLTFPEPGRYVVKFSTGGRTIKSLSLRMTQQAGERPARPPATFH